MDAAVIVPVVAALALASSCGALGYVLGWRSAARATDAVSQAASRAAASEAVDRLGSAQQEHLREAVDTVVSLASSKLGDQLMAGRMVIERERNDVAHQVTMVEGELRRVAEVVVGLRRERAEEAGRLTSGLAETVRVASELADTTQSLRRALASPSTRGQWGERTADDVLRAAGFVKGAGYHRQLRGPGGGVPDYTFPLPSGHVVNMDVKFPIDNYLRWLDATDDDVRARRAAAFARDVRDRVNELGDRGYIDSASTVDFLLLFVPNESVYGFIHEHDGDLIDYALGRKVVLCSPTTLFAVLAVIRHSVDNFLVEQRSEEILVALGELRAQWERWTDPLDKMKRGLDSAQRAYDDLIGPRRRSFERHLERLEVMRDTPADSGSVGPMSNEVGQADDGPADGDDEEVEAPGTGTSLKLA